MQVFPGMDKVPELPFGGGDAAREKRRKKRLKQRKAKAEGVEEEKGALDFVGGALTGAMGMAG